MGKKKRKRSIDENEQVKKKTTFGEIAVFIFLICLSSILLYGFLNYNSYYKQSTNAMPEVVRGPIDNNSAEFGYSHRIMPTVRFSINGIVYKAPVRCFGGSANNSIQPMLDELNAKDDITVTYVILEKLNFRKEKNYEIIGLQIDNTEYLNSDKGIKELKEDYKFSKNICLISAILMFAFSAVYFFFVIYESKERKKQ